jgi:hypothetical protein
MPPVSTLGLDGALWVGPLWAAAGAAQTSEAARRSEDERMAELPFGVTTAIDPL